MLQKINAISTLFLMDVLNLIIESEPISPRDKAMLELMVAITVVTITEIITSVKAKEFSKENPRLVL